MKHLITYEKFDNMSKGTCNICGEETYNDSKVCDDCIEGEDKLELDESPKKKIVDPPVQLPYFTKSQNIYRL